MAKWALLGALIWPLSGCGSAGLVADWELSGESVRRVPIGLEPTLRAARAALENGAADSVSLLLDPLLRAQPECVIAAILMQEAQIASLPHSQASHLEAPVLDPKARIQFAEMARKRSLVTTLPLDLLLAARVEPDSLAAKLLLDNLLIEGRTKDKSLRAWAHYGLAFYAVQSGDLTGAKSQLRAALKEDPGHLQARRLESRLEAGGTERSDAETLLAHWMELAAEAPEVDSASWYDAAVDLAILRVRRSDGEAALDALDALDYTRGLESEDGEGGQPWGGPSKRTKIRAGLVKVAALTSEGRVDDALAICDATFDDAEAAGLVLPTAKMQRAMLQELWLGDPSKAAQAWGEALEMISEGVQAGKAEGQELDGLMLAIQAQVRLERLRQNGYVEP